MRMTLAHPGGEIAQRVTRSRALLSHLFLESARMRKSRFNGCVSTIVTSVARASPSFRHHFDILLGPLLAILP
jgi:hypothetical protein